MDHKVLHTKLSAQPIKGVNPVSESGSEWKRFLGMVLGGYCDLAYDSADRNVLII